jgi:hypothetical protein
MSQSRSSARLKKPCRVCVVQLHRIIRGSSDRFTRRPMCLHDIERAAHDTGWLDFGQICRGTVYGSAAANTGGFRHMLLATTRSPRRLSLAVFVFRRYCTSGKAYESGTFCCLAWSCAPVVPGRDLSGRAANFSFAWMVGYSRATISCTTSCPAMVDQHSAQFRT